MTAKETFPPTTPYKENLTLTLTGKGKGQGKGQDACARARGASRQGQGQVGFRQISGKGQVADADFILKGWREDGTRTADAQTCNRGG